MYREVFSHVTSRGIPASIKWDSSCIVLRQSTPQGMHRKEIITCYFYFFQCTFSRNNTFWISMPFISLKHYVLHGDCWIAMILWSQVILTHSVWLPIPLRKLQKPKEANLMPRMRSKLLFIKQVLYTFIFLKKTIEGQNRFLKSRHSATWMNVRTISITGLKVNGVASQFLLDWVSIKVS